MMIFVPLRPDRLDELIRAGMITDAEGYAATPTLRREHAVEDEEEADFVAFGYAEAAAVGLADRIGTGRVVVATEVPSVGDDQHGPTGRVPVGELRWSTVTAVYLDEPTAYDEVARVRVALDGADPDDALSDPALTALLEAHDLLWHLPAEVAH